MNELARFGVSMDDGLLSQFDELIKKRGYANRSQAICDLVRSALVEQEWEAGAGPAVAAVSMVYDHHSHDVGHKLTHIQHDHLANIVSTLHVHLDHHNCLEILVLRGTAAEIKALGDKLITSKGVKHGKLMLTTEGRRL